MTAFGQYTVVGQVARTHGSSIWKAWDSQLERPVAVKEAVGGGDPEALRREAQILAQLDHPHIVRVYDVVSTGTTTYVVQEWVEGATLGTVRDAAGRLSPEQALGVLRGALLGLSYAHDHGVVHGDISPGNILLDVAGTSKLVDFGAATSASQWPASPAIAGHGDVGRGSGGGGSGGGTTYRGTPGFRSPEVAAGAPATTRSDVFAAAAVLADLLGAGPADQPGGPVLSGRLTAFGPALRAALQPDPLGRQPDAATLLRDLEQAADRGLGAGWLLHAGVGALVSAALGGTGVAIISAGAAPAVVGGSVDSSVAALHTAQVAAPGVPAPSPAGAVVGASAGAPMLARAADPAAEPAAAPALAPTDVPAATASAGPRRAASSRTFAAAGVAATVVLVVLIAVLFANRTTVSDLGVASPATTIAASPVPVAEPTPTTEQSLSAQVTPMTSISPSPTEATATGFNGTYLITFTLTAVTGEPGREPGEQSTATWVVTAPCARPDCAVSATMETGELVILAPDGLGSLTSNGNFEGGCSNRDTGELTGEYVTVVFMSTFTPTLTDGLVTGFSGTKVNTQIAPCANQVYPMAVEEYSIEGVRIGD